MSKTSEAIQTLHEIEEQLDLLILDNPERSAQFKRDLRDAATKVGQARALLEENRSE